MRSELADVEGQYDLITMHHSLEHFPDPLAQLEHARALLSPDGSIFVRIPLMQQAVWDRYGVNWSQIDPPRHLYLFPPDAFRGMAAKAGLRCTASGFDGLGWSHAWSEAYAQDIPMFAPDGSPNKLPLREGGSAAYDRRADEFNRRGEGDQGWFVLKAG